MTEKIDHIRSRNMNIFLLGYILYSLAFVYNRTNPAYMLVIANELLQLIGIAMVVFSIVASIRFKNKTSGYVKLIVALMMIWTYILITWSMKPDFTFFKGKLFGGESSLMSYFVPLVVLIPKKLLFLKKTMVGVVILGIGYFLYLFLFRDNIFQFYGDSVSTKRFVIEYVAKWLSVGIGFLVLTFSYQSKKVRIFVAVLVVVALLTYIFRARRALIFMTVLPVLMASALFLFRTKYKIMAFFAVLLLGFGVAYFTIQIYTSDKAGLFGNLKTRIDQDSRSLVDDCFINDFTLKDWVIGRGLGGRYFCPNVDENYLVVGYRSMIETDFLMIILKSGAIYLILLLIVMIPAIYYGLFRSRNILSKAAACWILFWILCLYPANVFGFSMNYLLVWISIGICYSREIRNIPEQAIKAYFLDGREISDPSTIQNR